MHKLVFPFLALSASAALTAQQVVIPEGCDGVEQGSNTTLPWNRVGFQTRVLYQHDGIDFSNQGVSYPITITGIEWRVNGGVTTGGGTVYPSSIVDMSTAATSWQSQVADYALNHGPDKTQVYNGGVTLAQGAGTTPGNWNASMTLSTPFSYDPLSGSDLCIEVLTDGFLATGSGATVDFTPSGRKCSRLWDLTFAPTGVSANVQPGQSSPMRLTYTPAPGLWAGFKEDVQSGNAPLTVQFTDTSITDDPAGILQWVWDFDNDGNPDATGQNPAPWTYTSGGLYTVSLTVFDATRTSVWTKTDRILVGGIDVAFTAVEVGPDVYAFTDQSTGSPNTWAWDFDNDGVVDSTAQNPVWAFPTSGPYSVRLTASDSVTGFNDTLTKADYIDIKQFTMFNQTNSWQPFVGNFINVDVKHPNGILITSLDIHFKNTTPAIIDVYVTNREYWNKDADPSAWRKVSTGTFAAPQGGGIGLDNVDVTDFYLPQGTHGLAIYSNAGLAYTNAVLDGIGNADIGLSGGRARTALFSGTLYTSRAWNGTIYYAPWGQAAYGLFGEGCAGGVGAPSMSYTGTPQLNAAFSVTVNTAPSSLMLMVTGLSNTQFPPLGLPLDLGTTGLTPAGCRLYVSPDLLQFLTADAAGNASWTLAIPNNPALLNAKFFNQALVLDSSVAPALGVMSDAWGGIIGL